MKFETVDSFISEFLKSGFGIGSVSYENELYNPVIFNKKYVPELINLSGDRGGKKVALSHADDIFRYNISDKKELMDIDYPQDK